MVRRLLLLVISASLAAGPAQARVHSVVPADADGPNDGFFTNDILYATGTSNILEGAAQLCVVPASFTGEGDCSEDSRWGRPNSVAVEGTFPPMPIEPPDLPPGSWQILADNGNSDDDPPDTLSPSFSVSPCESQASGCTTTIADAVMAGWKQAAEAARLGVGVGCASTAVFNTAAGLNVGSAAFRDPSGERRAIMAEILGEGAELEFTARSAVKDAVALLRTVSCGAFIMYDDIVADPPDPDYKKLAEPEGPTAPLLPADDAAVAAAVSTLDEIAAYGTAHRIGVERYQGAVLAGDQGWAALQAGRVGAQALDTQLRMRKLGRRLDAAASAVDDPSLTAATPEQYDAAEMVRERVRISGFTSGEVADLEAAGLTPAGIEEVRKQLGAPLPGGVTPMAPDDALRAAADQVDTATCIDDSDLCGFDTMGRVASAVGANAAVPPTVSVTSAEIRESDVGVNHTRVRIELSHPVLTGTVAGTTQITPVTTAEGELVTPTNASWQIEAGDTWVTESVATTNDTAVEEDETALITAHALAPVGSSSPATITVLDDDGPGDPPARPRSQRGLLLLEGANGKGDGIVLSEPDATEFTEVSLGGFSQTWDGAGGAWSPDGTWVLLQRIQPSPAPGVPIYRFRMTPEGVLTGEPVEVVPGEPTPWHPTFSANGRRLLVTQGSPPQTKLAVRSFDLDTGTVGPVHVTGDDPHLAGWTTPTAASITGHALSPDGSRIAFAGCAPGGDDCGIFVVAIDVVGAAIAPPVAVTTGGHTEWPSWSPNGRFLAFRDYRDPKVMRIRTVRIDTDGRPLDEPRTLWTGNRTGSSGAPAWAPDSGSVAFSLWWETDQPGAGFGEGGSTHVVDVDANGGPLGQPLQVGFARMGIHQSVLWSRLPAPPVPVEDPAPDPTPAPEVPAPTPAPPAPAAPTPVPPGPAVRPAALPSNRKCVSRRKFTIRLRESKADPLVAVEVYVGKKRVKVVRGARLTAQIDLRGLPKGKIVVKVIGSTRSGRRVTSKRRYRTCVPKRRR